MFPTEQLISQGTAMIFSETACLPGHRSLKDKKHAQLPPRRRRPYPRHDQEPDLCWPSVHPALTGVIL